MQIVPAKSVGRSYRRNHHYRRLIRRILARPLSILMTPDQSTAFVHAAIAFEGVMSVHWRKCKSGPSSQIRRGLQSNFSRWNH